MVKKQTLPRVALRPRHITPRVVPLASWLPIRLIAVNAHFPVLPTPPKTTSTYGSKCMVRRIILSTRTIRPSYAQIDQLSSLEALLTALSNLDDLCETIQSAYDKSLEGDGFERWNEPS